MSAKRLFSARKSARGPNRRTIRIEPLEERCLLAMMANWLAVSATDSAATEGNELYDLATLTIYALSYGLTPYTPQTTYIDPMPIDEADWTQHNVGIRRNNDYDSYTGGDLIPDSSVSSASAKEDDLIRVFVDIDETIPGLTYSVQRNSSYLKFWKSFSKSGGEYNFINGECSLTTDSNLWAEYTTTGDSNYTLTLVVRESSTDTVLATKPMIFRPFNSITCAFVGEFQDPGNPIEDPGINDWVIDQLKIGYDVHVWDDGFDYITFNPIHDCNPDGSGNTFDEIKNAVNNRGVTEVAIIGFSHGGGSVYNLCSYLDADLTSDASEITEAYSLVFTSYIDAVQNNFPFNPLTENRRPINSLFHLNQYQPNWFTVYGITILGGGEIAEGDGVNTLNLRHDNLTHTTIDNDEDVQAVLTDNFHSYVDW